MRKRVPLLLLIGLLLSACFRDASSPDDATSIPINNFLDEEQQAIPSATAPATTAIATLTATPELDPTNTFPVGGPPIESATEEPDVEVEETDNAPAADPQSDSDPDEQDEPEDGAGGAELPPTIAIPSFTPSAGNFGDSGITPTSSLATQPVPESLVTPTDPAPELAECVYVVQPNDTLFSIATANGVTTDEFVAANPVLIGNPNALSIGQELAIPNCVPEGEASEAETETVPEDDEDTQTDDDDTVTDGAASPTVHLVQAGDTLFSIAQRYGVSVDALIAANPALAANPDALSLDQELVIPDNPQ